MYSIFLEILFYALYVTNLFLKFYCTDYMLPNSFKIFVKYCSDDGRNGRN
jgi:hypothetical protein